MKAVTLKKKTAFEMLKCFDHLPSAENQELTILKGHLLIEGRIKEFVRLRLPNPKRFDFDTCDFSHLISIAWSLCADATHDPLWESIKRFNRLRNRLAHDLDDRRFRLALKDFLDFHTNQFFDGKQEHRNLYVCTAFLYSALVHLIYEVTEPPAAPDRQETALASR